MSNWYWHFFTKLLEMKEKSYLLSWYSIERNHNIRNQSFLDIECISNLCSDCYHYTELNMSAFETWIHLLYVQRERDRARLGVLGKMNSFSKSTANEAFNWNHEHFRFSKILLFINNFQFTMLKINDDGDDDEAWVSY